MNRQSKSIIWFIVMMLGSFFTATTRMAAQAMPPVPFIQQDICPFECCKFGRWRTNTSLRVYRTEGDTSTVSYQLAVGDTFQAVTGNIHMDKLGVVVVTRPIEAFNVGDTVFTLSYHGEGYVSVWRNDKVYGVEMFWPAYEDDDDSLMLAAIDETIYSGVMIAKPMMIWWVQVVLANGESGWIRLPNKTLSGFSTDEDIDGMDGCR